MVKKRLSDDKIVPLRSRNWVAPGDVLADKYRLLTELGEGGMGAVWLAHYEALDMEVAIKVIRADIKEAGGQGVHDRLLREARAAAQLGHPAIVRITDFGETARGDPFIVMELLEGEDLASALERRGRIDAVRAVRILLPIAHAMAAAHDRGIVHRDIKPENIYFAQLEDGSVQPKLIDFGVAKVQQQTRERITMAGALLGSPGYMCPESARGDDADARSDIWSFCVVLYEMMSGRLPFQGKNYHALLRSIVEDEVQPVTDFNTADEVLWSILEKGLTKVPDDRWQSMRQLGAALARWLIVQDVTEDICGASVVTTWLRGKQSAKAIDIFESMTPPRPAPDSGPPPAIAVRETSMGDEAVPDEPSSEPRPTAAAARPSDDEESLAASKPAPRADHDKPVAGDEAQDGATPEPEASTAAAEAAGPASDAARKPVRQRSAAGRLLTWVLLLALVAAAGWAAYQRRDELGLPPMPWAEPPGDGVDDGTAVPTGASELPTAPLTTSDSKPAPAAAATGEEEPATVDEDAGPAASASASATASASAAPSASATPAPPRPRRTWRKRDTYLDDI